MYVTEILLDTSGSMHNSRLSFAKSMLVKHINPIIVGHKVFIRTFNGENKNIRLKLIAQLPKSDLTQLNTFTNSINKATGGTPISAALSAVIINLKQYPYDTKTVVLVTDGEENGGGDYIEVAKSAKRQGVECKIHIIGVDLSLSAMNKAKLLANETGGQFINISSSTGKELQIINFHSETENKISANKTQAIQNKTPIKNINSPINSNQKEIAATLRPITNELIKKTNKVIHNKQEISDEPKNSSQNLKKYLFSLKTGDEVSKIDGILNLMEEKGVANSEEIKVLLFEIERLRNIVNRFAELSELDNIDVTENGNKAFLEKIKRKSEKYVWNVLKKHYKGRVNWVNKNKESGLPYDFIINNTDGSIEFYIDCKGTAYSKKTFYITFNEWEHLLENQDKYQIYRVFNVMDKPKMCYTKINNIFSWLENGFLLPYLVKTERIHGGRVVFTLK